MATDLTTPSVASPAAAQPGPASQQAMKSLSSDYDNFLQLLTAQIANQDPLEPMDASTFVSQLTELTQVEQTITSNANLEKILDKIGGAGLGEDLALLGRRVVTKGGDFVLEDGKAELSYRLEDEASQARAIIRSSDGAILREITDIPRSGGAHHAIEWDGRAADGLPLANGTYSIEIAAQDADEAAVPATTFVEGRVGELAMQGGLPVLRLSNGLEISSLDILSVR
ncbi:flagellar hook assembly protein FlgD [Profundibacterium mesophilum]|uniref:Basal-body rod modification protein FlgD n=1 Tax=Profundibacterium mesophilum KAUST100406-0324 TaxID=1037889 RepID=A0A921TCA4_9RHOB|nr:flagellar hook capping FlgD N-terminal domain-containing protein [Profundibacterium mesophilum]KAF0674652.1 putative Flagellar hook assembly protein FlgD [Profundibacterium mesophilum KAUST100406-0324]